MKIEAVSNAVEERDFFKVPHLIYADDPEWICPLEKDIKSIFNKNENTAFASGEAMRWVLYDANGKPAGRIAAFYTTKAIKETSKVEAGMGFFECINDFAAAAMLFDTGIQWLKTKRIHEADAPINFGERDKFWGLMVQGFKNPSYQENYNPPYYQQFFERFGFVKSYEQFTSEISYTQFNFERFNKLASRVLSNTDYTFRHYEDSKLEQFARDFISIYNQAWAHRSDFTPITLDRIKAILQSMRPILMEDAIWFAYARGKPAGFYINVIDINQIFKHLKGKLNLWGKLKFLWYRKFGNISRVRGIVFGVIPKYQNLGIETGMIMKFHDAMMKHPNMRTTELAWVGDFNPKMMSLINSLGAHTSKVHFTYHITF